ncbi:ABC transporter ATP-binding protein [Staphylococcus lugdunensis]|uniref:ABC transporter ATP-binding protein n=1 Tax=Staphylococcus lugdunensis TaxID=28035 RepID=A0A4Q9WAA9_STALU|nr:MULTISPECIES: ABC transporter ATP-binding protein [Staphylococcus]AMG60802.1 antibiotic ABC transporter ATP-binding protein [Staphylococcus lugdunensis]ARJ11617.1 antibiotic ABC transporter ATP-binding protein [Staphylococcus lugdunensis]AST59931.1 ABC transporter ATP-binding protein [Staphylococcus lugdunensis]ATG69041.1 ABC transporter ATP-binding protein [Staphylococcus lugdunensis]ATN14293.1 ABC transporter ATP-binding protein [Staphylococcus lugdunensis]
MIEVKGIKKQFGKKLVLNDINLKIQNGKCTAFIGKNGAGKSTLIDIIIGNLTPNEGQIIDKSELLDPSKMAILFQKTQFPKMIKVKELFYLHHALYPQAMSLKTFKALTLFDDAQLNQMANKLSGGQQRLLDFALALVGHPQLLILDEPTAAMDIETREYFWQVIQHLKDQGTTILYTSHYIEEVERMADHIVLLKNGVIQMNDTLSQIRQQDAMTFIYIPKKYQKQLHINEKIQETKQQHIIKICTKDVSRTLQDLQQQQVNLNEIEIHKASLLEIMFKDNHSKEVETL